MYFLFSLFISNAKNGETPLEIAQRKRHSNVVSYLLEELTGKIGIEGDGGVSVFRQGKSIFSPLQGKIRRRVKCFNLSCDLIMINSLC